MGTVILLYSSTRSSTGLGQGGGRQAPRGSSDNALDRQFGLPLRLKKSAFFGTGLEPVGNETLTENRKVADSGRGRV